MFELLRFEFKKINQGYFLLLLGLLSGFSGLLLGAQFRMNLGEDIAMNGSYVWTYMAGIMSIGLIFLAGYLISQIYFQEKEHRFSAILYSTPIPGWQVHVSRYVTVLSICALLFTIFIAALFTGQWLSQPQGVYHDFHVAYGFHAWKNFGLTNAVVTVTLLSSIAWFTGQKKWVLTSAVLIYIMYLSAMLLGKSPMFVRAGNIDSAFIHWASLLDPFGLSAFFISTSDWSVAQRNSEALSWTHYFLANRFIWLLLPGTLAFMALKKTSERDEFQINRRSKNNVDLNNNTVSGHHAPFVFTSIQLNWSYPFRCILSLSTLHMNYLIRTWPFWAIIGGMVFYLFMEWTTSIDGGILQPPRYASSGYLMDRAMQDFHFLALVAVLFIGQELVRRSQVTRFQILEDATPMPKLSLALAHWMVLTAIVFMLFLLVLLSGVVFQMMYDYPEIHSAAYLGFFLLQMWPVCLSAGGFVLLSGVLPKKAVFTWLTVAGIWLLSSEVWTQWDSPVLLQLFQPIKRVYSDFNGFDAYWNHALLRGLTGATLLLLIFWLCWGHAIARRTQPLFLFIVGMLGSLLFVFIPGYLKGHQPDLGELQLKNSVQYEKRYKKYAADPRLLVRHVQTNIELFPYERRYSVHGKYTLVNPNAAPTSHVLIHFPVEVTFTNAQLVYKGKVYSLSGQDTMLELQVPIQVGDHAYLQFDFSHEWHGKNPIEPFNAITENGSFMRISRYYPSVGYQSHLELESKHQRVAHGLDTSNQRKIDIDPEDFITMDMTIGTEGDQTAIGTGLLNQQWKRGKRNYFQYITKERIPFRFAVASARYSVRSIQANNKTIELYFEPSHFENVHFLLEQAKHSLEYFESIWGQLPYPIIRFAEISAHTRGFAATAYPGTVFITEQVVFHSHLQDLNDSAAFAGISAHELSHLWWGTRGVHPQAVPGGGVLTEGLAMYSEFLMSEKMMGNKALLHLLETHHQFYLEGQQFENETPLLTADDGKPFLIYSKAGLILWQLHSRIGEQAMQAALNHFYQNHSGHGRSPAPQDLIASLKFGAPKMHHAWIDEQWNHIIQYDHGLSEANVRVKNRGWEIQLQWDGRKKTKGPNEKWHAESFTGPLTIAWRTEQGQQYYEKFEIQGSEKSLRWHCLQKPVEIKIDPELQYLWGKENSWHRLKMQ